MNNNCHCPILDEKEATKEAIKPWAPVTRQIQRRNLVKTNWAVSNEHEEKEDDVVDHPGGKVEQLQAILDEKEVIKEPTRQLCLAKIVDVLSLGHAQIPDVFDRMSAPIIILEYQK